MDWPGWHDAYRDETSLLAQRLEVVRALLGHELDRIGPGMQIISLCAGGGDDVIGALAARPAHSDTPALLVELNPVMAARARAAAAANGLTAVEIREADAASSDVYHEVAPAPIVLLCGVLGNMSDAGVERTVAAMPQLCDEDGLLIWTRHRKAPDLTPAIRASLARGGFREEAFVSSGEEGFAVGAHRLARRPDPLEAGEIWFSFNR